MDNGDIVTNYHKLSVIQFSTEKVGNAVRSPFFDSGLVRGGGLASGPDRPGRHQTIRPLPPVNEALARGSGKEAAKAARNEREK